MIGFSAPSCVQKSNWISLQIENDIPLPSGPKWDETCQDWESNTQKSPIQLQVQPKIDFGMATAL